MLVVGVALDALGDVVEDVLVALGLLGGGALGVAGLGEGGDLGVFFGSFSILRSVSLMIFWASSAVLTDLLAASSSSCCLVSWRALRKSPASAAFSQEPEAARASASLSILATAASAGRARWTRSRHSMALR